jgi:hypothetical protein
MSLEKKLPRNAPDCLQGVALNLRAQVWKHYKQYKARIMYRAQV